MKVFFKLYLIAKLLLLISCGSPKVMQNSPAAQGTQSVITTPVVKVDCSKIKDMGSCQKEKNSCEWLEEKTGNFSCKAQDEARILYSEREKKYLAYIEELKKKLQNSNIPVPSSPEVEVASNIPAPIADAPPPPPPPGPPPPPLVQKDPLAEIKKRNQEKNPGGKPAAAPANVVNLKDDLKNNLNDDLKKKLAEGAKKPKKTLEEIEAELKANRDAAKEKTEQLATLKQAFDARRPAVGIPIASAENTITEIIESLSYEIGALSEKELIKLVTEKINEHKDNDENELADFNNKKPVAKNTIINKLLQDYYDKIETAHRKSPNTTDLLTDNEKTLIKTTLNKILEGIKEVSKE